MAATSKPQKVSQEKVLTDRNHTEYTAGKIESCCNQNKTGHKGCKIFSLHYIETIID